MHVLITGGAGFIGSHLCAELVGRGIEVSVLDDLSSGRLDNLADLPVDVRIGSVTDRMAVNRSVAGVDAVVHLAALASVPQSLHEPMRTHEVNVNGTLNVLQSARETGAHVIVASSAAVYGNRSGAATAESTPPHPLSPYATSKLATEAYATSWQESFGLPTLALRFFNVFGPRQHPGDAYAAVVPAFVWAAMAGHPIRIHGDGRQTRDFIPVFTVASLLADAVQRRVVHPLPVNVAFGQGVSLLDLADLLENVIQRPLAREFTSVRPGDIRNSSADDSLLRDLFPDLRRTGLAEALQRTVSWRHSLTHSPVPLRASADAA
ncbi:NAD-dependent epimerase/dehydratase family protein [Jidongwangia harbinensis]|uniref:NAD-dependent epimerase/dehydratase family protein n=1 Tax=Jidongwangia harbinensis TaxID=2878561 RepID=UPI001CD97D07|nr:NAD-dependent epimerase/dehydratase family protein [Jidongwangia harbinensis]MCA2215460.1 NAD-dependent epimerase/dehydratase family protein [Jidongwangia harbinensis]